MGVSSQCCSRVAVLLLYSSNLLPESLQDSFLLSPHLQPVTVPNLSSSPCCFFPVLHQFIVHLSHSPQISLAFLSTSLSSSMLEVSPKRGTRRAQTEGGKELERPPMTPVWPVTTMAGKCVFSSCFHLCVVGREHALSSQSPLLPAVYKLFFKGS